MRLKHLLSVFLTLLTLSVGQMWGGVSSLTFTSACGGSGTANDGAEWTVTSDASESTFIDGAGIHYGTNSVSVTYVQLVTSDISGTVSQVVVNARDARASATISVSVGGTNFTCSGSSTATNTSTNYTFTGTGSGEIIVKVDRGSSNTKAIYVLSVAVTYTSTPATITLSKAGSESVVGGTHYVGDSYTLPKNVTETCGDRAFVGWSSVPITTPSASKPTASTYHEPEEQVTLAATNTFYAVYADAGSGGSSNGSNTLVSNSNSTYYASGYITGSGNASTATWTADAFTMTQNKNNSSNNIVLTYGEIRIYASHSIVFTPASGTTITSIVVNANNDTYASALGGSSISNCTKSVSSSTVTITPTDGTSAITLTNSAQSRLNTIVVSYTTGGGTTYSNYTTQCCTPLGSINGSFNVTSYTASARAFSWVNETTASDVDHYELSYKEKTAEGDPTPIANNITNSTHAYTHTANLTQGTTYTYYLTAVGASGHCDATVEKDVLIPYATSTVTFNDNGKTSGSVPDAITQNTGTTVTVPGNTGNLAKDNYAFGGWNTKDDGTGTNYVANETFTLSNDITLYAKWDCAKKVTLTKGTPSNGSFSLSEADGDKYTCDGSVVVTVSDITPASGYRLVGITQTGLESGVSIDQANKTVTYAQYANGSSTINVEFEQIPVHTITWMVNGAEYTTGNPTTSVVDGNGITALPTTPTSCNTTTYGTFVGWYTTAAGSETTPSNAVSGTKAVINHVPTGNETYYAVWANGTAEGDFALVTDASELNVGDVVTIASVAGNSQSGKVIKAYNNGNNWPTADVTTAANGKIAASTTGMQTFTLAEGTVDDTWAFYDGTGYIYAANSSNGDKNYMKRQETLDAAGSFAIEIDVAASVVSRGDVNGKNTMRYNESNNPPIFSCYGSGKQSAIYLYKQESGATAFISTCCTKHTITLDDEIANGSVASTESSVCEGTSVTLTATATPNEGRFKTWNVTGMTLTNEQKATNPLTISMPDNNITVSAIFDALYAISKVEEGGTITLGRYYAAENDVVTISAVAKQDYEEPRVLKVYKTGDESTEITITAGAFKMPGYPVTAKVTYTASKTPLPAPTMGANSDLTYNSVQLNWTNVANNSGYVLTVMQGEDVVEGYDAKAIDKDATSAVISGLEHLTAYTYTLYAKGDGVTYVAVNTAANGGFTTLDYPTVKIYYSENEVLRVAAGEDQKILTDFTLPSDALTGCTQKELVGWTTAANAEYSHDTDAPAGMMLPGAKWQIPTNENCTLYAVYAKNNPETVSWSRVTAIPTLTDGGTFIMGYEATAKSGTIVPLRSADCGATTIANGYFNAGTSNTSSGSGTIDMSSVTSTSDYEVYISSPADGKINIQQSSSTGNYYGSSSTGSSKNTGRLYTSGNSDETNIIPEWSSEDNNQFKLRVNVSGDYKYLKYNTGDPRFAFYNSAGEKVVFYKKNVTPATTTKYATQCMAQVAKPSISGVTDGETYEEAKTITITSATTGATIYYTTNGTEPTTSSNAYSAPFEVSANGDYTIRAIAVKADMVNSDEATAVSFSLDLPFTTIASFIAAKPTNKKLVFTAESNARVLAYNKNRIYIQDGTGAMYLYNTDSNNEGHGKTWASGKKIVGTLTGTYTTNDNMPRMTVTDFGATDVTDDAIELPTPIAVEELATNFGNNVCKLVTINGVSIRSESVDDNKTINMTKNDVTYNIYNAFNALTGHKLPLGTTSCTVTGILGQSNSGATLQLMPISADGISTNGAEAVLPVLNVTGSTNSAEPFEVATNKVITFTPNSNFDAVYAINDGEKAAVTGSSNVTITDEENATKVTIRATREYYTTKEVSYYYRANSALIEYDITKGAMSHGSATIQNAQGDAITYAVGGATVTLVANPAEHYHWVSWEVTAGGEPVTVTNNTFEMPNAAVTVSATFEEDDYATVAFAKGNAGVTGDAPASQKVYVGENATMPGKGSMILSSHNFAGWKLGDNAVLNTGDHYTVTAADHEAGTITFEAQWEPYPWASAGKWELVTSASEITVNPTTYVIFADTLSSGNTACGLTQNENNRAAVSVTKTDNLLTWTGADPAIFIVEEGKDQGTLAFYDAINNNYIHAASSANKQNYLRSNTDKNTVGAAWTINAIRPNGGATITADTYSHNLLNLNGNLCAAYTSPQKGLAIYKFVGGNYYNIAYAKGTEDEVRNMPEGHVTDENGEAAIKENTPIRVGYTFTGWKDQDENVYTYNDGQIYAFTKNVTLTAQWEEQTDKYTVSYDANGSSDAVPAEAAYFENAEVTVAGAVSKEGFVFMGWECNGRVYTAGSKFYMPATDMPMVAKYAHGATYDNMTKVNNVCSIESHDAPEGSEAVFTNSYTTATQLTSGMSMTLTLSGYTGYTIEGVILSMRSNNNDGAGTLNITIDDDAVATHEDASIWYGSYHNGSFENILVSMNPKTVKYGEDIVITIAASENSLYCQSFTILYDLLPVEVENTTTIEARDLAAGTEVIIHDGGTLNVNADKTLDNLTVEAGGEVVLDANKLTVVGTFTLETTMASGASGQLTGATASNFATNGPAYIDITLGAGGRADHWHAITVPFPVDAINGIYDLDGNKLVNEVNYAIMEYLGNVRAQGKYGWKKYRKTLVPGTFYLMTVDGQRTTYRFKKTTDGALVAGNSKEIFKYAESGDGQTTDAGWNGVGNPTLMYGKVNAEVQVLDPENYVYVKKDPNSTNFVVGTPFFYQADAAGSISMLTADAGANYAPARVAANGIEKIKVSFGNEEYTDYLDISASEEAKNEYQIGKDLVKMTMTNTPSVAQIFGNAYNAKLCMVYAPMVNDKATFDLTLYAPAAGTYTIAAPSMENATLYLTKNGRIYWNLTMGACELDLNQGQNNEYGLVLRAEVPSVTTGVDEINAKTGVQKVVIDEHVYILRGGEMYDMTGKMVK